MKLPNEQTPNHNREEENETELIFIDEIELPKAPEEFKIGTAIDIRNEIVIDDDDTWWSEVNLPKEEPKVEIANVGMINLRCWESIQEFNELSVEEVPFEKYEELRTHGRDDVTRLSPDDFEKYLEPETVEFVDDMFKHDKYRNSAKRWIIRGLKMEHAIKLQFLWKHRGEIVKTTLDGKIFNDEVMERKEDYIWFLARINRLRSSEYIEIIYIEPD